MHDPRALLRLERLVLTVAEDLDEVLRRVTAMGERLALARCSGSPVEPATDDLGWWHEREPRLHDLALRLQQRAGARPSLEALVGAIVLDLGRAPPRELAEAILEGLGA